MTTTYRVTLDADGIAGSFEIEADWFSAAVLSAYDTIHRKGYHGEIIKIERL